MAGLVHQKTQVSIRYGIPALDQSDQRKDMPRVVAPLTDTKVRSLKPKDDRYTVTDGNGLVLEVLSSGTKI
jgi:hypothetical protein